MSSAQRGDSELRLLAPLRVRRASAVSAACRGRPLQHRPERICRGRVGELHPHAHRNCRGVAKLGSALLKPSGADARIFFNGPHRRLRVPIEIALS
jgi:hypothetical protein